jgi:hypothetical protein
MFFVASHHQVNHANHRPIQHECIQPMDDFICMQLVDVGGVK